MSGQEVTQESKDRRYMMRTIFAICNEAGIDRADRIELACSILDIGSGLESYNDLSIDDLGVIHWALRHWKIVQEARLLNGTISREAHVIIDLEKHQQEESDQDSRQGGRRKKRVDVDATTLPIVKDDAAEVKAESVEETIEASTDQPKKSKGKNPRKSSATSTENTQYCSTERFKTAIK